MIDSGLLHTLGVNAPLADVYAPLLLEACPKWDINDASEVAAFLSNCVHESTSFTQLVENLNYSAQGLANTWRRFSSTGVRGGPPSLTAMRLARNPVAIANTVYANRNGNGDFESGDGWKRRGAGLIQLTFTNNHRAFTEAMQNDPDFDVMSKPELLQQPYCAVVSACWFWVTNHCKKFVIAEDWAGLRRSINGGVIGLDQVNTLREKALEYFGAGA